MIKPFVNERVSQSIIFHDSLESFHGYVDKEILPHELGGTNGEFDNSKMACAVNTMSEYFYQVHRYIENNAAL